VAVVVDEESTLEILLLLVPFDSKEAGDDAPDDEDELHSPVGC
jgi:hypothetical protein